MLRKIVLFGSAAALFAGSVFIAGTAQAATTIFTTTGASVTCNTVIGSASIAPPISTTSTGTATVKVKAALAGCTATGATPAGLTVVSGTASGTLSTVGAPGCAGLLAPATITGNLIVKWKVASGQKLDFPSSTASGGTLTGGVFTPGAPFPGSYGQFTLSGQTLAASSAFAGGSPSTVAVTGEDIGNLGGSCLGAPPGAGIKLVHLSLGTTTL